MQLLDSKVSSRLGMGYDQHRSLEQGLDDGFGHKILPLVWMDIVVYENYFLLTFPHYPDTGVSHQELDESQLLKAY